MFALVKGGHREGGRARIPFFGEAVDDGAARISKVVEFSDLVEGFSRGVVY